MTNLTKAVIALAHAEYLIGAFERGADSSEYDRDISDFWEMLAPLRAALAEAPGEERDERAAFEDWIAPTLRNGSHLNRSRVNQVYTDNRVAAKWAAWQARAMLAARPEAPTVAQKPLTRAQISRASGDAQIAFCLNKQPTYEVAFAREVERLHGIGKEGGA